MMQNRLFLYMLISSTIIIALPNSYAQEVSETTDPCTYAQPGQMFCEVMNNMSITMENMAHTVRDMSQTMTRLTDDLEKVITTTENTEKTISDDLTKLINSLEKTEGDISSDVKEIKDFVNTEITIIKNDVSILKSDTQKIINFIEKYENYILIGIIAILTIAITLPIIYGIHRLTIWKETKKFNLLKTEEIQANIEFIKEQTKLLKKDQSKI